MFKHSLPSIEKFAAYLDGNLPQSEMLQFSQLAEQNEVLRQLLDASSLIDDTIAGFTDTDLQLPKEISGSSFEIPQLPADGISGLVALSPEPTDELFASAAACANEDVSQFSANIDNNLESLDSTEQSVNLLSGNGELDGGLETSGTFSEDL